MFCYHLGVSTPIEVTTIYDEYAMIELMNKNYANLEPGFQIDGVRKVEELLFILDAIAKTIPVKSEAVIFDSVQGFIKANPQGAHTDGSWMGLAVHQELADEIDVILATSRVGYVPPHSNINDSNARNVRFGQTKPGRLTIFSEGGYDWLDSSIHNFIRKKVHNRPHEAWARYAQFRPFEDMPSYGIKRGAKIAFKILDEVLGKETIQSL